MENVFLNISTNSLELRKNRKYQSESEGRSNMRYTNKYIKIIVFVLLASITTSCEDYLVTESNSTFTETTAFANLDFATKAVYGIYEKFTNPNFYDYYYMYTKIDNDIECAFNPDEGAKWSLAHYAGTEGSSKLEEMWAILFLTIERANICIDNIPKSPIWEGEYAKEAHQLYGEAVTLRALCYYELITTWGDVPFSVKSTQAGDDFYQPKTERDSIYEYLIQDLKDVEEYVPWMRETHTAERVNKGFVKGLRARMALAYAGYSLRNKTLETRRGRNWQDYYQIANQECREIMESGKHQLNPSFENIFKTLQSYSQDLNNNEVLFEIAFGRLKSGTLGQYFGMPHHSSDPKYGRASGNVKVPLSYYYSFDRKDSRRNASVELYNYSNKSYLSKQRLVSTNGTSFSICKWRKSWIVPSMGGDNLNVKYTGVNFPMMRYADVVLMFAETENEINGGPTQAAKDALSLIRKRAFPESLWASKVVNYVDSVSVSKDDFFNAIVDEKAWEFGGGEFLRKYDLIRWNLLGPKIKEMKEECLKIINDDPEYASLVPDYIFWKYKDDNETLDILNPDYRLPGDDIDGYTRSNWLPKMSASNKTNFAISLDLVAHGYDETKNNHLFPIAADIIVASNGVLSNDQIP